MSWLDDLDHAEKFLSLIKFGKRMKMQDLDGEAVQKLFISVFNQAIDDSDAKAIAMGLLERSADPEQTLAEFVSQGGLIRIFAQQKDVTNESVIVCPDCHAIIPI